MQEPEEATKQLLLEPLLQSLGFTSESNYTREFKIIGDSVDYLLKSDRPLIFVEAKSLLDKSENLFIGHREQVQRYIRNYRVSPEQVRMERPVAWIVLASFAQFHFIRVNEETPTFSFALDDLWKRREEFWDLLALDNLETGRIEELYEQRHKAGLDQRFLADLKRWRLLLVNGFALRNQTRSLDDITHASQQLLNRFLFSRMLETNQLIEWNKLARAYSHYEVFHGDFTEKTFAEFLRESLFQEIKFKFNTELFKQPLLCDTLALDNSILSILIGHEPLSPEVAATCGFESGQGELLAFRHLYSYDFSLMSSDVMGAVYEKFLAHRLSQGAGRIVIEDTDELRKKEGIYYTPRYIVDYIVAHTLGEKIKPVLAEAKALLGYKNFKAAYDKICELSQIKVLDPAMGSGSFLLGAFDALAAAYNDYNAECERQKRNGGNGDGNGDALFDAPVAKPRPVERLGTAIVSHNLFGVDLDAQAVEVAKLNLWIRLMAAEKDSLRMKLHDPNKGKQPQNLLPALAANFKRGNSLIDDAKVAADAAFDWEKEFPEIMEKVAQASRLSGAGETPALRCGFDVVIGNPPYGAYLDESAKTYLNANYTCQSYQLDSYLLFLERSIKELLRDCGLFGMIIPNPWLTNILQQDTRRFVTQNTNIEEIVHFLFPVFTGVTVDTEILLLKKAEPKHGVVLVTIAETQDAFETFQLGKGITQIQHDQDAWRALDGSIINIFLTKADTKLAAKIASKGVTADSLLEINVGIKPYQVGKGTPPQNKKIVDERSFDSVKKLDKSYRLYLRGSDIDRYTIAPLEDRFIKYGPWLAEPRPAANFDAPVKILMRQTGDSLVAALDEHQYLCLNNLHVLVPTAKKMDARYMLGVLNSKLMNWYYQSLNPEVGEALAEVKRTNVAALPIRAIDFSNTKERREHDSLVQLVKRLLDAKSKPILPTLSKAIAHSQRTPCNLAHYLQTDFASAVKEDKLIDDVQRTGFVHEIRVESVAAVYDRRRSGDDASDGHRSPLQEITFIATVSDQPADKPRALPILADVQGRSVAPIHLCKLAAVPE